MAQYDPQKTIALDKWYALSIDERGELLEQGYSFDQTSGIISSWQQLFTRCGAYIPEETLVKAYKEYVAHNHKLPA